MAPKKRSKQNSDLTGTNVRHKRGRGGVVYYYYEMPDGNLESLGTSREDAIEAALALNLEFRPSGQLVKNIVERGRPLKNPVLVATLDEFLEYCKHEENLSDNYLRNGAIYTNQWRDAFPAEFIKSFDAFKVATYIRNIESRHAQRNHYIWFKKYFLWAASIKGYETSRPMSEMKAPTVPPPVRKRHTWEERQKIYSNAEPWLKVAMNAALYTLQRRSDLTSLAIGKQIDMKKRTITVLQQKTRNYAQPVYIEITMGDELYETIKQSQALPVFSRRLIKRRPKRFKKGEKAKASTYYVTPEMLTREYTKARDDADAYANLTPPERPTLHSERALGIWLYWKAGYSEEYIMALAGHATERMFQHYKDGHEKPEPVKVNAGLSLSQVDLSKVDWATETLPANLQKLVED